MGSGPGAVLPPARLAANFAESYPMEDEPGWSYGRGFYKMVDRGQTVLGHWGGVAGYAAAAYFDPDAKVGVVILKNSDGRIRNELVLEALRISAGKP
jgi:CubicO group peptidase (beta-lactamase class C family)